MACVLVRENTASGKPLYLVRANKLIPGGGAAPIWECTYQLEGAKRFASRTAASEVLRGQKQQRPGWRVLDLGKEEVKRRLEAEAEEEAEAEAD